MATANEETPSFRCDSPSSDASPTPAIGACPELSRCVSTASSVSHGSATEGNSRESLGSFRGSTYSRQSSGNYSRRSDISFASSRQSTCSSVEVGRSSSRRRGFVRPQGTDFAASARHRESVLSLGSIAHLQYYFARTGLLDGKGAQLARKNKAKGGLDLSSVSSSSSNSPRIVDSGGNSPELGSQPFGAGPMVESPTDDHYYSDDFEEDPDVLPPTASTYIHRNKPVPKPPTIEELKADLTGSLEKAAQALRHAKKHRDSSPVPELPEIPTRGQSEPPKKTSTGWHEVQGMHILDVMTLAIRAARNYYTAHEVPERLDAIKSEKEIRTELLSVMETLKQMATRQWSGGMKDEELRILESWISGLFSMLKIEEEMIEAEKAERSSWTWLQGDWAGKEVERELAFMASLVPQADPLPDYTPAAHASECPTPYLISLQNGIHLIELHNAAVKRSKRRFGLITTFHTDTDKPYRSADNIRYWAKAAELRWEVLLKVDALGIVYNNSPEVWVNFEKAIMDWSRKVREEITSELLG
ncbi:uncharacterized protein CCOS01_13557 [Colletotrichum costaricense]|uniref:Calponin-homology (CH) domain-containing protein n=1 Tax=Colletotrichum costaricense TaxID=1209916 RepID=A0AAJ0DUV2_9PEZI|nr:uncharacterized protein CCOS01_13557 [Colletotrichum costaricense]KAK1514277.1 hypothetical protein CCOS01_13557 [Colletotrichum costaricense]